MVLLLMVLSQLIENLKHEIVTKNAIQLVDWHFIRPGAAHMDGHLAQHFTYKEFSAMLTRIEACLNSKPLSSMTDNPSDTNP